MATITGNKRDRFRFMLPLGMACMLNPLNSTMLATAMTDLTHSFARSYGDGALLITPLYMTAIVGQPLMGRLADIYSPKKVNIVGLILVIIAALIGVLAPSFQWLIVSRIFLGLGTSAAFPSSIAIVQREYSSIGRTVPGPVLGILTVTSLVSLVLGPVLGGYLTEWLGWKGIFLINIPWVLITLVLLRAIPATPPVQPADPAARKQSVFVRVDALGVLFFSLLLISLFLTLTDFRIIAGAALNRVITIGVLLGLFAALISWERKKEDPFLNVRLFAQRPSLILIYFQTTCMNYILYLTLYSLPGWIQGVKQVLPSRTGLLLLPMSIVSAAASLVISRRKQLPFLVWFSAASMCAACGALFFLNQQTSIPMVIGITILLGLATGVNPIANQVALSVEAPPQQMGTSFGLSRTFGYIGAILSGVQFKTIFGHGASDSSLREIVWLCTGSCLLLCVFFLLPFFTKARYKNSMA